jgi:hypothetical protein
MHKTSWTVAVGLLLAGTAGAEDIDGKWNLSHVLKNGELVGGGGAGVRYDFNKGQFAVTGPLNDEKGTYTIRKGQLVLSFTYPDKYTHNCTYTLEGKRLTYTYKRGSDQITAVLIRD